MATSTSYWNIGSHVRDELDALSQAGSDAYAALETNDDPGELAEALSGILKNLEKLAGEIVENVGPLRKVAQALDALPGVKS